MSAHHSEEHHEGGHHPTFRQYVFIAIILFVITAVEFLIIVPESLQGSSLVVAPLFILSILKFVIVIGWYMHLRFDPRMFTTVFLAGLFLALLVVSAVLGLFGSFQPTPRPYAQAHAVPYSKDHAEPSPPAVVEPSAPAADAGTTSQPAAPAESEAPAAADGLGQEIFLSNGQCYTCHTIAGKSEIGVLGPALTGIGADAATRKPGMSAEEYLRESILEPDAFIEEGCMTGAGTACSPGVMAPLVTAANLSDADVEALVQYLLTQ